MLLSFSVSLAVCQILNSRIGLSVPGCTSAVETSGTFIQLIRRPLLFTMTTKIRLDKKELRFGRLLVGMNSVVLAFRETANLSHKIKLCTLDVHSNCLMGVEGTALRSRVGGVYFQTHPS